jgi:hypothetical protein
VVEQLDQLADDIGEIVLRDKLRPGKGAHKAQGRVGSRLHPAVVLERAAPALGDFGRHALGDNEAASLEIRCEFHQLTRGPLLGERARGQIKPYDAFLHAALQKIFLRIFCENP